MPRLNPLPPLVTGPIFRLTVQVNSNAQLYETVLDYMAAAPVGVNLALQVAWLAAWRLTCQAAFLATQSNKNSLLQYSVAEIAQGNLPTYLNVVGGAPGTEVSNPLPGTVAAIITKYSALKGQHGRGRNYLMGVPISFTTPATDPNVLNVAGLAAYDNFAGNAITPVVAGGTNWSWVISTRPLKPLTLVSTASPVTTTISEVILATVRRRREGRGI